MKTFREHVASRTYKERKSTVGAFKHFMTDIYRERFLSPHEEMLEVTTAYNFNSIIHSSVNTMAKFIIGNDLKVVSEDEATRDILQKMVDQTGLKQAMREVVENTIKTGNGYLELDWEDNVPVRFYPVADSSRMYINFDKFGKPPVDPQTGDLLEDEYFLQRVDEIYPDPDARFYNLGYHVSVRYYTIRIKAIPIHKKKMIHFKLNTGDDGVYGRSILAACINDWEMLREMERSIAIISKYKAVPRKIFSLGDKDMAATDEETINFAYYMENLTREQNAITNKPVKVYDLNYAGDNIDLTNPMEHVRKKLTTGLAPEFVLGFSKDTNRATAREELVAYILSIMSDREVFLEKLNEEVIRPYIKRHGLQDAYLEFGELDFEDSSAKTSRVVQQWQTDLITRNEAREALGLDTIEKEEEGDKFFSATQTGGMGGMPDLMGGMPDLGGLGAEEEQSPGGDLMAGENQLDAPVNIPEEPTAQPIPELRPKVMKGDDIKTDIELEVNDILSKKTKPVPKFKECNHNHSSSLSRLSESITAFSLDEGIVGLKKNVLPKGKHPQKKNIAEYATSIVRAFRNARNVVMSRLHTDSRFAEGVAFRFTEQGEREVKGTVGMISAELDPIIAKHIKQAFTSGRVDALMQAEFKKGKEPPTVDEIQKATESNKWIRETVKANRKYIKKYSLDKLDKNIKGLVEAGARGDLTTSEVGKKISTMFNRSAYYGLQVAQTEINRVHNKAVETTIKESGQRGYWWNLNPGASKTGVCTICKEIAAKCREKNGFSVKNKTHPRPVENTHPGCFCYMTPYNKKK